MKQRFILSSLFIGITCLLFSQNIDHSIAKKINSWNGSFIQDYSKAMSHSVAFLSIAIPTSLATYGYLKKEEKWIKDAVFIGSSIIEAGLLSTSLKAVVNRERPYKNSLAIVQRSSVHGSSFPSRHTALAFSLATSLSIRYPKWYIITPSVLWATSVGFARINQGVHYPSDVLSGAAIGIGCVFINTYINKWINQLLFKK